MRQLNSARTYLALGAFATGALVLGILFTPVRAMVERAPAGPAQRGAAATQNAASASGSSGVISVKVVPNYDGPPPPAARFYGAVTAARGTSAGDATVTAVSDDGTTCGSATASPAVSGTSYTLDITNNVASCRAEGAQLRFLVNGNAAKLSGRATIPPVSAAVHADLSTP